MLGNGRLEAMCFDGTKRLCHIRGKLRKRQWINTSGKKRFFPRLKFSKEFRILCAEIFPTIAIDKNRIVCSRTRVHNINIMYTFMFFELHKFRDMIHVT